MSVFEWTDERTRELRRMFRNKMSAKQIAQHFGDGITRNAVCGKLARLGLNRGAAVKRREEVKPVKERAPDRSRIGVGAQVQAINRSRKFPVEQFQCRDAADVVPLHLNLLELEPYQCRWPYGEKPYTFCGNPVVDKPYCYAHHLLSLPKPAAVKQGNAA